MAFGKLHKTFCSCGFEKGKRKQFFVLLCILRETHILFFMLVLACNYPQLFEEEAVWWTIVLKLRNLVCWVINYVNDLAIVTSVQFSSVTQSCPTLWDPMNCSMPGLPVHHQLPEFTQTMWMGELDCEESWAMKKLMLLNCGVGEDSWESLGLQGDPTSPFWRRSVLGVLWKEWC